MKACVGVLALALLGASPKNAPPPAPPPEKQEKPVERQYIGRETCAPCHAANYERYVAHAFMSRSYQSIEKLVSRLSRTEGESCLRCHTTGYRKPGGFVDMATTPHQANLGCESCHGPGSVHVETAKKSDIVRKPPIEVCNQCHMGNGTQPTPVRVRQFMYRPLRYAGAH